MLLGTRRGSQPVRLILASCVISDSISMQYCCGGCCWWWVLIGDVDDSPRQSPQLPARIKPNYRQRKVRKTGLSTVELQKAMPELSDLMSAKQSSLAAYVTVCIVLLSFILVPAFLPLTLPPNQCNIEVKKM